MQIEFIPTDKIVPNPRQPRSSFDKDKLEDLGHSIESHDLLQPITVELLPNGNYKILLGERRWRAVGLMGVNKIPAIVRKNVSDLEGREISLIENWHREKVAGLDEEKYIAELYTDGMEKGRYKSVADMAGKTGIAEATLKAIIQAYKDRKDLQMSLRGAITYVDLRETQKLKEDTGSRKKLLDLREKGKIKSDDLREYSEIIQKSTEPVKKALLKNEPSITPEIAEEILEIKRVDDQATAIGIIEKRGLSGERAKEYAKAVKQAAETSAPVKEAMLKSKSKITPEVAKQVMTLKTADEQKLVIQQIEAVRMEEDEAVEFVQRHKAGAIPQISKEEWDELEKSYESFEEEIKKKYDTPEVKARGFLFRNWIAHRYFLGGIKTSFCPHCGREHSGHVVWNCCGLSVDDAYEETKRSFQTAMNELDRAKRKEKLGGDKFKK